jgi:hypothetical protein
MSGEPNTHGYADGISLQPLTRTPAAEPLGAGSDSLAERSILRFSEQASPSRLLVPLLIARVLVGVLNTPVSRSRALARGLGAGYKKN